MSTHPDNTVHRFMPYVLSCFSGLLAAALGNQIGLTQGWRYALAFGLLTLTASGLLWREAASGGRDTAAAELRPAQGGEGFFVTRLALGLEHLQARSEAAAEPPTLWLPSPDPSRAAWLQARGADLVVAAQGRAPGLARVEFSDFGVVYLLLCLDREPGVASGSVTVPNLAVDLVDQRVDADWLEPSELSRAEPDAIAASVAFADHATRRAWREAVAELPADHPVRLAVAEPR